MHPSILFALLLALSRSLSLLFGSVLELVVASPRQCMTCQRYTIQRNCQTQTQSQTQSSQQSPTPSPPPTPTLSRTGTGTVHAGRDSTTRYAYKIYFVNKVNAITNKLDFVPCFLYFVAGSCTFFLSFLFFGHRWEIAQVRIWIDSTNTQCVMPRLASTVRLSV